MKKKEKKNQLLQDPLLCEDRCYVTKEIKKRKEELLAHTISCFLFLYRDSVCLVHYIMTAKTVASAATMLPLWQLLSLTKFIRKPIIMGSRDRERKRVCVCECVKFSLK